MKNTAYLFLLVAFVSSCKKNDYRESVVGEYTGPYTYSSALDTVVNSGVATYIVTVDKDSDDKLILTRPSGYPYKIKLFEDLDFSGEASCSPRGHFTADSLYLTSGCFNQPPYSLTKYKLKKINN